MTMTLNKLLSLLLEEEKEKRFPKQEMRKFLKTFFSEKDNLNNEKLLSFTDEFLSSRNRIGASYSVNKFFVEKGVLTKGDSNATGKFIEVLKNEKELYSLSDEVIAEFENKIRSEFGIKKVINDYFKKDPTGGEFLERIGSIGKTKFMKKCGVNSTSTAKFDKYLKDVLKDLNKDEEYISYFMEKVNSSVKKSIELEKYIMKFSKGGKFGEPEIDRFINDISKRGLGIEEFIQSFGYGQGGKTFFYRMMDRIINNKSNNKYFRTQLTKMASKIPDNRSKPEAYFANKVKKYIEENNEGAKVSFNKIFYRFNTPNNRNYDSDIFITLKDGSKYAIFWDGSPHLVPTFGNDKKSTDKLAKSVERNINKINKAKELGIKVLLVEYLGSFSLSRIDREFEKFKKTWENRDSKFDTKDERVKDLKKRITFSSRYIKTPEINNEARKEKVVKGYYYSNDSLFNKLKKYITENNLKINIYTPNRKEGHIGRENYWTIVDMVLENNNDKYIVIWSSRAPIMDRTISDKRQNFKKYLKNIKTFLIRINNIKNDGRKVIILHNKAGDVSGDYKMIKKIINTVEQGYGQNEIDKEFYNTTLIDNLTRSEKYNKAEYDRIVELNEQLKIIWRTLSIK